MSSPEPSNQILSGPAAPQDNSPLFSLLPPEVRSQIFSYALTDFPDPSPKKRYKDWTIYKRPAYSAPRRNDTRLLRTCRAVYRECWFMPFLLKEHTHWIGHEDRAPPHYQADQAINEFTETLKQIVEQQGGKDVEVERLRVFAQMWKLEQGGLADVLKLPNLNPRTVTLTIRHADWWWWENDEPLRFEAQWIKAVNETLRPSVREVCIEIESVLRKKIQINAIATQMIERWSFKRQDGVVLYPEATGGSITGDIWTGSSCWQKNRWTRDETEPGKIQYFILSVRFRPEPEIERRGGRIDDVARNFAENDIFDADKMRLYLPPLPNLGYPPFSALETMHWESPDEYEEEDTESSDERL
ncbi:hypothetical protein BKA56DRAFT_593126 [Ilyonectria sp. MPI-CAGE-AT-0026]|nr:hypothetical protein BKA56DRAFT_593126 [Ilyonectria sp. MPI-CAGE-AT-0026]